MRKPKLHLYLFFHVLITYGLRRQNPGIWNLEHLSQAEAVERISNSNSRVRYLRLIEGVQSIMQIDQGCRSANGSPPKDVTSRLGHVARWSVDIVERGCLYEVRDY